METQHYTASICHPVGLTPVAQIEICVRDDNEAANKAEEWLKSLDSPIEGAWLVVRRDGYAIHTRRV
jgi:hypothetical protein